MRGTTRLDNYITHNMKFEQINEVCACCLQHLAFACWLAGWLAGWLAVINNRVLNMQAFDLLHAGKALRVVLHFD
jgi:Zn-dependent alcohol dehydrogenase